MLRARRRTPHIEAAFRHRAGEAETASVDRALATVIRSEFIVRRLSADLTAGGPGFKSSNAASFIYVRSARRRRGAAAIR